MNNFVWNSPIWWAWFNSHKHRPSLKRTLAFLQTHDGILSFHACRPINIESYYDNGLHISNLDSLDLIAQKRFPGAASNPLSLADLFDAIKSVGRLDHQKLYAAIDERHLIEHCGHYLIYGSEHLCKIGAYLTQKHGFDFQSQLKQHGMPTIFRIRLSFDHVPVDQVLAFAEAIRSQVWDDFYGLEEPPTFEWSFTLKQSVPPENILSHWHPKVIPDPLRFHLPYQFTRDSSSSH